MNMETTMKAIFRRHPSHHLATVVFCCVVGLALPSSAAAPQNSAQSTAVVQKTFDTPEDAALALINAANTNDVDALKAVLGSRGYDLVTTGDQAKDTSAAENFAARAKAKHSVQIDAKNENHAVLLVGTETWPLPIPMVKQNGKWMFDVRAGREETLLRRIGSNELDAIEICRGYVDAQEQYALEKHDGAEVNQYAQRIFSTPGKRDGLVWQDSDGTLGGPISEAIAKAIAEGSDVKPGQGYHGYYFKILKGQGPAAPLGQMDFVVEGAMIGGFALAAAPIEYGVTGVRTFIVGYDGVVYQKDFGSGTLENFRRMERFNPDKTWKRTDDEWPPESFEIGTATGVR